MGAPPYILIVGGIFLGIAALTIVYGFLTGQNMSIGSMQEQGLWPQAGQTPTLEDVKRLADAGHKIPAIKMYRMIKKVGLKEAKDAVEELAAGR